MILLMYEDINKKKGFSLSLHEKTKVLENQYILLLKKWENETDLGSISLSIPKQLAPYQFHLKNLLREYSKLQDQLDELFYETMTEYKMQMSELSNFSFNSSELKRMIESTKQYREFKTKQEDISADMKLIEEIIKTIQNYNFSITNAIKWRFFMSGENV